jgi:hypothetical protein
VAGLRDRQVPTKSNPILSHSGFGAVAFPGLCGRSAGCTGFRGGVDRLDSEGGALLKSVCLDRDYWLSGGDRVIGMNTSSSCRSVLRVISKHALMY